MTTPASGSKRPYSAAAAAAVAERRVQPRHSHSGPNPNAANGAVDADDGADAAAARPPSAVRLHRHALESVFAFLRRGELTLALRVSRDWLAAARSMRNLRLNMRWPAFDVRVMATSAMGRHVSGLGDFANEIFMSISVDTLSILAQHMPHLRRLACRLPLPPATATAPLLFPSALRNLQIDLCAVTAANIDIAMRAIGQLPLLQSLIVKLPGFNPQISLAPLAALAHLRSLHIRCERGRIELKDAQVNELRALPWLEEIYIPTDAPLLRRLIRQPHQLQWQQISLPHSLDDEIAPLLPQLPSLTTLQGVVTCTRLDWLGGLPNLTDVHLFFAAAGRAEPLIAGLQRCTNIEFLSISFCPDLTAEQLAILLPRLPRLRELELEGLDIDSLSFLAQPPMTEQLSSLELEDCTELPLTELRHVHALRGLRTLKLCGSFYSAMDEYSQSLFEPPSFVLPQLEEFDYAEPVAEAEADPQPEDDYELDDYGFDDYGLDEYGFDY